MNPRRLAPRTLSRRVPLAARAPFRGGRLAADTCAAHRVALKSAATTADITSVHADLFAHEGGFQPRPAWQVIEAARRQKLTGELALATAPTTTVYLRDGQVYFAERATDGALGVRLLVAGVITRPQLDRGVVLVGGVEHLGRLFERDVSIDRATVQASVEMMADEVLVAAAEQVVAGYRMTLYRRHPSGIDRWLPEAVADDPVVTAVPDVAPIVPAFAPPTSPAVATVAARLTAAEAVRAIATGGFADEVAAAVREALSAIEAATQPPVPLWPHDFGVPTPTEVATNRLC